MAESQLKDLDDQLKNVIHSLYTIQACVHAYQGPNTQEQLIKNIHTFLGSLSTLSQRASNLSPQAQRATSLPPEIISYVDSARNPDIYTREFVELVQRGNAYLHGKNEALCGFRDALAEEIVDAWPELRGEVEGVVDGYVRHDGHESGQDQAQRQAGGHAAAGGSTSFAVAGQATLPIEERTQGQHSHDSRSNEIPNGVWQ